MGKTAINNALVFDGTSMREALTVVIQDNLIVDFGPSPDLSGAKIVDGKGLTLLPGFIDAHVHLDNDMEKSPLLLGELVRAGITTALDMGLLSASVRKSFHNHSNIADVRFVGNFATSSGSAHCHLKLATEDSIVDDSGAAERFIKERVTEDVDYIKIVADVPGPSQGVVNVLSSEARKHGKLTVAHAARKVAWAMAQEAKVDIITHSPMDELIGEEDAKLMKEEGRVCVPTLIMEKTMAAAKIFPSLNYEAAKKSVTILHSAGVPIIAGTDANSSKMAAVQHGASIHQELELLVEAGLSNQEALRAATSVPAKWFRLEDRGVIAAGKRADLLLISGNPVEDIGSTKHVKKVWAAGKEIDL